MNEFLRNTRGIINFLVIINLIVFLSFLGYRHIVLDNFSDIYYQIELSKQGNKLL